MSTLDILDAQEDEPEEFPPLVSSVPDFDDVETKQHVMAPALSSPALASKRPICLTLTMPNPAEMVFHSPSDQIVGTPFSVNNSPRFEYPFPSSSSNSNSIESTPTLTGIHSNFSSTVSSPLILSPPLERHYSPTHPKLCTADPPMPPSLLKKPKWAVGLLGRKSNISQKYASGGSAGKGKVCDHLSSEHARARRFSVGTPPELYTTPAEGTDSFFSTTSGLNRTTSAQC